MTSLSQYSGKRDVSTNTSTASICPIFDSGTRVDIVLLVSAFFLQRFSLPFAGTHLALDVVFVAFILLHQFLSGNLVIQYDRLLWFLAAGLLATCSLLVNLERASVTSYLLFLVLCSLLTFNKRSSDAQYMSTLRAFQFLVMFLSCLAIGQFLAQFVVSGYSLVKFYGIVPDVFFTGAHTIHKIEGSSLLKSNGIFLAEPSNLTQVAALGILIEVLEFRRPRYLLLMVLGSMLAYSGAGMVTLLLFLPLASLRLGRVAVSVLLVGAVALGLFKSGIIDVSIFQSRSAELESTNSSGFNRFIGPFWMAGHFFSTANLQTLLIGSGPGTKALLDNAVRYSGINGWLKQLFEYGFIGSAIFICFLASCLHASRCPKLVLGAVLFTYFFIADFLITWVCTILIVLCTLHGPEVRPVQAGPPQIPRSRHRLTAVDWQPS
jgi:hypothetical protein